MSDPENRIRSALSSATETPGAAHDAAVLAAARAYAAERRRTKPRWYVPVSLAASLVIGVLIGRALEPAGVPGAAAALYLPVEATRGAASRSIPVEEADAEHWYRYIQELVAAGEAREAAAHLERFNALHPGYVYQP